MSATDACDRAAATGRLRHALAHAFLLMALAPAAFADEVPAFDADAAQRFFAAQGCNACHAIDEYRLGPPFRAVAARYANDKTGAEDLLVRKVIHGGAGAWGFVPMVSNPDVRPIEARAAVRFILSLELAP